MALITTLLTPPLLAADNAVTVTQSPGDFVGFNYIKLVPESNEGAQRSIQIVASNFQ